MIIRNGLACAIVFAFLVACGGAVAGDNSGGSVGGRASSAGGSAQGGSPPAQGGKGGSPPAQGGSPSQGGSFALPDACTLPMVTGPCDALVSAYWHDPKTGVCIPFTYGGCEGNANRFASLADCQSTCRGVLPGGTEFDPCNSNGECQLLSSGCCGNCGQETARSFVAVRADAASQYNVYRGCSSAVCGECPEVPVTQQVGRYFYPACIDGQCAVRDLRLSPLVSCGTPSDCQLRCGTGCCSGCSATNVVALRRDADTAGEFCGGVELPCPKCMCNISPFASADCVAGRCVVAGEFGCTFGMDQSCNDDSFQSSLSGQCLLSGICACNPGRTLVIHSGRCL